MTRGARVPVVATPRNLGTIATTWLPPVAVGLVALLVFLPAVLNGFVNLDDPMYVTGNPSVRRGMSLETVRWAFTSVVASNFHPLTMLSHALDVSMFGLDPRGHHLTSVLLHAVNSALVVVLGRALLGDVRASTLAALLFAVHPLRVESVAWVSERKDVLSALFFLGCLLTYVHGRRTAHIGVVVASWALFVLGMLSKPMLVTLPALLLVLEPLVVPLDPARPVAAVLRRLPRLVPFFVVAALGAVVTVVVQADAMMSLDRRPFGERLASAPVHLVRYLGTTVWPADLSVIVPLPPEGYRAVAVVGAVLLLALVTVAAVLLRSYAPMVLAGWLWFVGVLVPVLGLAQAGRAAVADRYTLLPHVGLFLAASVLLVRSRAAAAVAAVALVAMVPCTLHAIDQWQSTSTLLANAVRHEPGSAFTQDALAGELLEQGNAAAAEEHARIAVGLSPRVAQYRERLAQILAVEGQSAEAEALLRAVIADAPSHARARWLLSALLHQLGRNGEAVVELRTAFALAEAEGDQALLDTMRPIVRSLDAPTP